MVHEDNGRELFSRYPYTYYMTISGTYACGGGANAAASLCLVAGWRGAACGAVVRGLGPENGSFVTTMTLVYGHPSLALLSALSFKLVVQVFLRLACHWLFS